MHTFSMARSAVLGFKCLEPNELQRKLTEEIYIYIPDLSTKNRVLHTYSVDTPRGT